MTAAAKPTKPVVYRVLLPSPPDRCPKNTHYRLRVEVDPDGWGIEIAEEQVTSLSAKAHVLEGTVIDLLDDEAEWLHEALGAAIRARHAQKRVEQAARTRKLGKALEEEARK